MGRKGNFEWTKLEISSQAISNNGKYQILEKYSRNIPSGKAYKYKFKCLKCGKIFEATKQSAKCPNCASIENHNKHIGEKTDRYEILAFDHIDPINKNAYYKVKCLKCGDISIKQWAVIIHKSKNYLGCLKCKEGNGRIPSLETPINGFYRQYKKSAESRKISFNLTLEEFKKLINKPCTYCGSNPTSDTYINGNKFNKTNELIYVNGIDRIDSTKGYSVNNCVPCCTMCNKMKLDYSLENFKTQISKIYHYSIEGSETIENIFNDGSEQSISQANGDGNGGSPEMENDIVQSTQ